MKVLFINDPAQVPAGGRLLVWGMQPVADKLAAGVRLLRAEDGFLRSVGLGADLIRPLSWVIDSRGIYFNAEQPSDLEHLLANKVFQLASLQRAALLRQRIVALGLTKYNVGAGGWRRPAGAAKVILAPGQVESDASLRFAAYGIRSNIELLRTVRQQNPQAYILYKPHPDVLAGLRAGGAAEDTAGQYCDELLTETNMGALLNEVDEVHVLTSLTGFEALLRGKTVHCYGQPFYAGWGLTTDVRPQPRRTRRLTLDELVAGALIDYPLYLSRDGKALISPEAALDELVAWRERTAGRNPWWRAGWRMILRRVVGVS